MRNLVFMVVATLAFNSPVLAHEQQGRQIDELVDDVTKLSGQIDNLRGQIELAKERDTIGEKLTNELIQLTKVNREGIQLNSARTEVLIELLKAEGALP